jgi:alpha-1,2-mannosyltransferase
LKTGVAGAHPYWLLTAVAVCAVGMTVAARAARRGEELVAVLVTAVTGLLVSPISWSHHWVWAGPLLAALVALAWRHRSVLFWLLATALTGVFAAYPMRVEDHARRPMGIMPFRGDRELAWNGSQTLVGNLYVWIGLLVIVATLAYTFLTPSQAPRVQATVPHQRRTPWHPHG